MLENIYTTKMSANKKQLQDRFTKMRSSSGKISKMMSVVMALLVAVTFVCATVVMASVVNETPEQFRIEVKKGNTAIEYTNYYREIPTAFSSQGLRWPCEGEIPIYGKFGKRTHPITGEVKEHNGIDIIAPEGTDVRSAIYGTVTDTGYNAEKGYFIVIEKDNIKTVYTSLTKDIEVKKGDKVERGQTIGKVGKTGTSTGAHLHFEVLVDGEYLNPELIG